MTEWNAVLGRTRRLRRGVTTALLPVTFFEVVMHKAFRRLVDDEAEVSVDTGLRAADKLQSFLDRHGQADAVAEMGLQVHQLINAMKSAVPEEMWDAIIDKVDQLRPRSEALDAETEDFDDDGDAFDPSDFAEDEDYDL